MRRSRRSQLVVVVAAASLVAGLGGSASGAEPTVFPESRVKYLSQGAALHYWSQHEDRAPVWYQAAMRQIEAARTAAPGPVPSGSGMEAGPSGGVPTAAGAETTVFNNDSVGVPQNGTSLGVCWRNRKIVLGGAMDLRGVVNGSQNATGWQLSTDGGHSVAREGRLPAIVAGARISPSRGEGAVGVSLSCGLYMASLNGGSFGGSIGVYRSDAARLLACPGGDEPSCWPSRREAVPGSRDSLNYRPSIAVGRSGGTTAVVWIAYSEIGFGDPFEPSETMAVKAVRCAGDLSSCSAPITISGAGALSDLSSVTIGPDGRTYIAWADVTYNEETDAQAFDYKLRVAEPGSLAFGPARLIHRDRKPLQFGGKLHANDFRANSSIKIAVGMDAGTPRVFATWESCLALVLGFLCEGPQVLVRSSATGGATWTAPRRVSYGGDNYFPTISADPDGSGVSIAWYTNRFDESFHARQDVELVNIDNAGAVTFRKRITGRSTDTQADPVYGGLFIGDHIQLVRSAGEAYVHYTANHKWVRLVGQGYPAPQQDNFLTRVTVAAP